MVKERLQKIMAAAGVASRRKCEEIIIRGGVIVNGQTAKIGESADITKDQIEVEGVLLDKPSKNYKHIYLMLNKPKRYITTVTDMYDRKTVMHLLPEKFWNQRLFPIGRLDRDAEGILILTNDGEFANRVMHPRYVISKTYRVWLDQPLKKEDKERLERGIKLQDGFVKDIKIYPVHNNVVDLKLHVGKNKIVKRIFHSVGYNVDRLVRIKVGKLELQKLGYGKIMELNEHMIQKIFEK